MAAKSKPTDKAAIDAYYAELLQAKVAAGLPLEDAQDVVARQRAQDHPEPETEA